MSNIRGGHKWLCIANERIPEIPVNPDSGKYCVMLQFDADKPMTYYDNTQFDYDIEVVPYNTGNKANGLITNNNKLILSKYKDGSYSIDLVHNYKDENSNVTVIDTGSADNDDTELFAAESRIGNHDSNKCLYAINVRQKASKLRIGEGTVSGSSNVTTIYTCLTNVREVVEGTLTVWSNYYYVTNAISVRLGGSQGVIESLVRHRQIGPSVSKLNMQFIIFSVKEYADSYAFKLMIFLSTDGGVTLNDITHRLPHSIPFETYSLEWNKVDNLNIYGIHWAMSYDGSCMVGLAMHLNEVGSITRISDTYLYISTNFGKKFKEVIIPQQDDEDGFFLICDHIAANGNILLGRCYDNPYESASYNNPKHLYLVVYNIFKDTYTDYSNWYDELVNHGTTVSDIILVDNGNMLKYVGTRQVGSDYIGVVETCKIFQNNNTVLTIERLSYDSLGTDGFSDLMTNF